jgi:hypothetical protein
LNQSIKDAAAKTPPIDATMAGFSVVKIGVILLLLAWILSPVYLWRVRQEGEAWKLNAALAFLLFPVWAYAIDAVGFRPILGFDGHLASIVLGAATLLSGLVQPKEPLPPPTPEHRAEPAQSSVVTRTRDLFGKSANVADPARGKPTTPPARETRPTTATPHPVATESKIQTSPSTATQTQPPASAGTTTQTDNTNGAKTQPPNEVSTEKSDQSR